MNVIKTVKTHPVATVVVAVIGGYALRHWHASMLTVEQRATNTLFPSATHSQATKSASYR